jgi:superfamily II DNA helicase RecQ
VFNEKVEHWLPPSASRRSILCHQILYPSLKLAGYQVPEEKHVNKALSEMFAKTMNLPKPLTPKLNRDFISVLTDYIAPSSLAKTSTTQQLASQFHHSQAIHNQFYSADTFRRDNDGNMIPGPLSIAHQVWNALGENTTGHTEIMRPVLHHIILTKNHYDYAAKRAYGNQSAKVSDVQYSAINFASSRDIKKHAFVFMGCGTGKSGVYNLLLLGSYLNQASVPRCMVISPHNSLLSMHKIQSKQYLRGTSLSVVSLLPVDIQEQVFPTHFDLLYISIHAFNDLMINHQDVFSQWKVQNIFVDEYHNVVSELFRYNTSWNALRLCASLNTKMMFLSATSDNHLMKYISQFFGIRDYEVIGSVSTYPIPNVRISIIKNEKANQRNGLLDLVVQYCRNLMEKKKESRSKIHAITMSRPDANDLSDRLNNAGLSSMWLTSSLPPIQKIKFLQSWEEGDERVLVSTFTDGIDNSSTEDVIIVGGTYSIYSLVQAVGRIRPNRQNITKASLVVIHSNKYVTFDEQSMEDNISRAVGAGIFPQNNRDAAKAYYQEMFHLSGYKKWLDQPLCYRKHLYELFSIPSSSCNHCTNCRKSNAVNISAIRAETTISREHAKRKIVHDCLKTMLTTCIVCCKNNCNGIQCFPSKPSRCFCCHVAITKRNFHESAKCPANTTAKNIDTKGQACPSCFMCFSPHIPCRGSSEDHLNNRCLHQKRLKRVLLYGVENSMDAGISARNLLVSVLSNPLHWYEVMSTNIEAINKRKTNA